MSDANSSGEVEYRLIPGWPGYVAGDDGSIWSCWIPGGNVLGWRNTGNRQRRLKEKHVRSSKRNPDAPTYRLVRLQGGGRSRHVAVHRLVLETFVGQCPPGQQCRHADGNASNNRRSNLSWGTCLENHADKVRHGTSDKGEQNGRAKLTDSQVIEIRALRASGAKERDLMKRFGVGRSVLQRVYHRKSWKHIP